MKKQIPNTITLMNFLCGTLSIVSLLVWKQPLWASFFIVGGALFDFCDGLCARALGVSGAIGKELDSLADVVSFGLAPSLIAFDILASRAEEYAFLQWGGGLLCYVPLFMAMMSCYRLAKFNTDTRQTLSFIGLPTPANALVWLSIPVIDYLHFNNISLWGLGSGYIEDKMFAIVNNPYFVLVASILFGLLLVSELPLFALKFKNLSWADNKIKFIFLIVSLVLIIVLDCYAIVFIVLFYILLSLTERVFICKS